MAGSPSHTLIRPERIDAGERNAVHALQAIAFGQPAEADLVDALRREDAVLLSLVAEFDSRIIGHILFSRMWIDTESGPVPAVALAPVAVLPEFQNRGVGGQLIRDGLQRLRQSNERIAIVLGHPEYYERFGFSAGKARSLSSPFPPEAYMALELAPGALDGVTGKVRYAPAFGI